MFGIDPVMIQKVLSKVEKIAEDQKKLTTAMETTNTLLPELITELKRLNTNMEKIQ